jgi:mRNA-degrading endonuclease HigB of HigAB toxin-antitoxin module
MAEPIQFISMIRLRPGAPSTAQEQGGQSMTVNPSSYIHVEEVLETLGADLKTLNNGERAIFNVLGNDYDVVVMGEVQSHQTLAKIDAVLKLQGYIAKTHPIIQSDEYRKLAEETASLFSQVTRKERAN